jgi:hypothetical protein
VVYPQTGLPVVVEIAPGANSAGSPGEWPWVDATYAARLADGITITEGRGDWGAKVDPGSIALTFDNRSGHFSEYNPLGQWYGLLGRDTPLRVRLRRGEDDFARTVSNGLGTSTSGQAWTPFAPTSAWSVGSGVGTLSISATNSVRRIMYGATLLDAERLISLTPSAVLTGASLVWRGIFRYIDSSNYYSCSVEMDRNTGSGLTVTCKIRRTTTAGGTVEIAVASPVAGLFYTAGQPVHTRAGIAGATLGVKAWIGTLADEPAGWSVEIDDYAHTTPGQIGEEAFLVSGNTNTLPYTVQLDNYALYVDLAGGFVPAWVPRWDRSRQDRTVPVVAKGVLHRMQPATGKSPPRSPLRRTIGGSSPVAYIPLEDGQIAGQAASALPGHPPATVTGTVSFDPIDDYYIWNPHSIARFGTTALADISAGGKLFAYLPASATTATASHWVTHTATLLDLATLSGDIVALEWTTPGGTYVRWQLVVTTLAHTKVIGYTAAGATTTLIDDSSASTGYARLMVIAYQSGGNIAVELWRNGGFGGAPDASTSVAGTLTGLTSLAANTTGVTASIQTALGHWAVWAADEPPYEAGTDITDGYGDDAGTAPTSYVLEAATDRLPRLAAEDGVTLQIPVLPTKPAVVRMGNQLAGTPRDLLDQPVLADGGVLAERPFRLEYTPRESLYNQTARLTLTSEQLGEEPEPDATDQAYRNRFEAKRIEGSSAVAEAPEVANGAIVYDDSADLSLGLDATLPNQAGWRLHLASKRGLRWPKLKLDLAAEPTLIDQWLNCRSGSRIAVTQPPEDVAGQDIDVLLEGHTTTLGFKDFDVVGNFSPADVWTVGVSNGPPRSSPTGSTLGSGGLALGGTSFLLAFTTVEGPWTTVASDCPLDLRIGGERVTASAISGSTSPQTVTISARGVNGVTRAWPAGTRVEPWLPMVSAL